MQKNKLLKENNLDFLARLTTALAPADEAVRRQIRESQPHTPQRAIPSKRERFQAQFTMRHLGSI